MKKSIVNYIMLNNNVSTPVNGYIESLIGTLGMRGFSLSETDIGGDIQKRDIEINEAAAVILKHSMGMIQYINGQSNLVDTEDDIKKDNSLILFFITESVLLACEKNELTGKLNLDCLTKIDTDYFLMENFMNTIYEAPRVGVPFSLESLTKTEKVVQRIALEKSNKSLQLTGLSLLSNLNLDELNSAQKKLLLGNHSLDEVAMIIVSDIERLTHETLRSWLISEEEFEHYKPDVNQSISQLYGASLATEFKAIKAELSAMPKEERDEHIKNMASIPDGCLVTRSRASVRRIIRDADALADDDTQRVIH